MFRTRIKRTTVPRLAVAGLDASLNSSGFAYRYKGEAHATTIKPGTKRGCARLRHNKIALCKLLDESMPDVLVIEGYSMGKQQTNNTFNMGEWGGIARLSAWERGITLVTVTPSTLKQLITGRGNAKKPDIAKSCAERFGLVFTQDDEADAYCLMLIGEALLSGRGPEDLVKSVKDKYNSPKPGISVEKGMMAVK